MVEAKKSLMQEVLTLKKIVDEVCPLIIRPKNGTSIMEMSSSDKDTEHQEQTGQSESESENQSRHMNRYSAEKNDFESASAGSCDQEICRMVGSQRSDLSTERPKRCIDIKNSVRCRRENTVYGIEGIRSNDKEENVIMWVFEGFMNETRGCKRENTVGEIKGIHSNENEENVINWVLEDPRNEFTGCELKDKSTESESRSLDVISDRIGHSWDNLSCETERVAETIAGEPILAGELKEIGEKGHRRYKFFQIFSRWICGRTEL